MSLLNQKNPFETFTQCADVFFKSQAITAGIDLDDAVVALKRHARVVLGDEELAMKLEKLAIPIRDRDIETLRPRIDEIVAGYGYLAD